MLFSSILAAVAIVATPIATASPISSASQELSSPIVIACGRTSCFGEQVCCNPACSTCAAPGKMCTMEDCGHLLEPPAITEPAIDVAPDPTKPPSYPLPKPTDGVACGKTTCAADQVCCNSSCGICTPPDGACIMMFCGDSHRADNSVPP
ncbi:hypothetical protein PspLS_00977 [Pyricularia sp. CBS 133598]|nr:hypothetical protein PspLS_00977 [Pyricularia sp. CBS 133598]